MAFELLFQYLGTHIPALGALVVLMIVVGLACVIAYKAGIHTANKRWRWDVEHMPLVIGQDIREKMQQKIAGLEARNAWLKERVDALTPLTSGVIDLVRGATKGKEVTP